MIEIRHPGARGSRPAVLVCCSSSSAGAAEVGRSIELALSLGHENLVVDLGESDDAAGELLGVLQRAGRRAREAGGWLTVVSSSPNVRRLLGAALSSQGYAVCATREEALAA